MDKDTVDSPLIGASDLSVMLGAPGLLVVDCRFDLTNPAFGQESYASGHVPGAVFASVEEDLAAPRTARTGRHPLPAAQDFAAVLGGWGFTEDLHVVAYDQASGAWAARLWWMLRARGHVRVQVLDGGWAAWLAAGGDVSTTRPSIRPTSVQPQPFAGVIDAAEVSAGLSSGSIALVDARAPDRFQGRNETIDPVAGHVPGALSHPYSGNLDAGQHWLAPTELRRRWAPTLERAGGRTVVAMCGSGVTACHNLLALELAGRGDTRLYAGSWSDWITDPARPIATGE
jgi:thiosulfate/3-mercaptopyruvate sulfurtransferase